MTYCKFGRFIVSEFIEFSLWNMINYYIGDQDLNLKNHCMFISISVPQFRNYLENIIVRARDGKD